MSMPRHSLAALFSWLDSRPNKWLVAITMVCAGLFAGAACGLSGVFVLVRLVPRVAQRAPNTTPRPVVVASPVATSSAPAGTPDLALDATAAADSATCYVTAEWPGPPGNPRTVALPAAQTDPEKLAQAQSLYEQGKAAFDAQEWEEAVASFDQALALDPRHPEAYMYRGAATRHIGDTYADLSAYLEHQDLAIADLSRAIAADPSSWRAYNDRGASYQDRALVEPLRDDRRQWYELALADYVQASELDPAQDWPWRNRAAVHISLGQCELAIEELDRVQEPTAATASTAAAAYNCQGSQSEALNSIEWAISVAPQDSSLYLQRSHIYLSAGEYAKALDDANTAAELWQGPSVSGGVWYQKAAAEYRLGRYDVVEEYVLTGRFYARDDWGEPYYYLGMVFLMQGRIPEAIEALEWAEQTLDEDDPLLAETRAELEKLR